MEACLAKKLKDGTVGRDNIDIYEIEVKDRFNESNAAASDCCRSRSSLFDRSTDTPEAFR